MYIQVKHKLITAIVFSIMWVYISVWLALPWFYDVAGVLGNTGAIIVLSGLAFIPGFMNMFMIVGLIMDKRQKYHHSNSPHPPISILIAAYNEKEHICHTLYSIFQQAYDAEVEVIVIDDGSRDETVELIEEYVGNSSNIPDNFSFQLISPGFNQGKAKALNLGLLSASHDLIITLDADSYLFMNSLKNITLHLIDGPDNTAAVAGSVLVRNSRQNWITKFQEWDYFLGISIVKRVQSLLQGTMVAQGAFSIYRRKILEEHGGWRDTVGEDIVLTWGFLEKGYRIGYAENAFCFTSVPSTYSSFYQQRKRWSRGLIEAFSSHPKVLIKFRLNLPFVYFNLLFPYIDFMFLMVFVPGVIAALFFQYYLIVGWMTLLLLPLMIILNSIMLKKQKKIFEEYGLLVRKNYFGMLGYMLFYQIIMTPACLVGYVSEVLNLRKDWGTK